MTDPSDPREVDAELARVLEVLDGAHRTARDPDVGLLMRLAEIESVDDSLTRREFAKLVQDAYSD